MVEKNLNAAIRSQKSEVRGQRTEVRSQKTEDRNQKKGFGQIKGSILSIFCHLLFVICYLCVCSCARPLYKNKFVICGTFLEVTSSRREAASIVYEEFKRLDKVFNFYDPTSELSRLNNTYHSPIKVSKEMIEVLQISREVYNISAGAFDPSYGVLFEFWKNLIQRGAIKELPAKEEIEELKKKCGMDGFEVNIEAQTVVMKKAGLKIDLAAIAEGYMVDQAVLKLKMRGISDAIINAGGDIYCLGRNSGKPWVVGVKNPQDLEGIIEKEVLIDEAITTSGGYEQFFELAGKRYSHLIDPRSGYPVDNNIASVSVIAKRCVTADSFATAFCVSGLMEAKKILATFPSAMRIFVVTVDKDGKRIHKIR